MLVLKGLHRIIQLQLLQHYWKGHRLGLPWYWMACLGNEQRLFCRFWDCTQALHFGLLLTMMATLLLLRDSCPQIEWSSELNSPIPVHFSSLIPKMSMFTLAISCLTTSNFPWFMDLIFQAPMQYYLYSIRPCFYHQSHPQLGIVFALTSSLHSFWSYFSTDLQQHIGHLPTWGVHLSVFIFLPFHTVHGVLKARILK